MDKEKNPYKEMRKCKKKALSITIDAKLLDFLKEDMKTENVEMTNSSFFNELLRQFVDKRKQKLNPVKE